MKPDLELIEEIFTGIYRLPDSKNPSKRHLATRNLTPCRAIYGEQLTRADFRGEEFEFRHWDPFRSKLSAAILKGLRTMPILRSSSCLYLGASTGTTASHVSDILGKNGKLFAVEVAPRVAREFLENVVKYRSNIIPIIADAREPERYHSVYGKIDSVYCDIAQQDQTEIAIANCKRFFSGDSGGTLMLVVKASSIDVLKSKGEVFKEQVEKLVSHGFEIVEKVDLEPYDRNHALIVSRKHA